MNKYKVIDASKVSYTYGTIVTIIDDNYGMDLDYSIVKTHDNHMQIIKKDCLELIIK